MGLTKSERFWNITLTEEEFSRLRYALINITRLDNLTDVVGRENGDFLFDLEEMIFELDTRPSP
jgi:hypothetical protein